MDNETGLMQRTEEADVRTMVAAVKNRLAAVRELLRSELKGPSLQNPDGVDYGIIPGTKKKVLYQPGAEKIALMFQFTPSYTFTRQELPGGHLEVTALCTLTHSGTGRIVGQCEGSASTMESKHRYRGAAGKPCPKCGATSCKPSKKEWGGGYWCDQKAGGCGERFKASTDEAKALDELPTTKTENQDPADQRNTVSKIAQKRAYVGAVKGASAASEVFTVDMESAEATGDEPPRPPVAMPTEKKPATATTSKAAPVSSGSNTITGTVEDVIGPTGKYNVYNVVVNGDRFSTFSGEQGEAAKAFKGKTVVIGWEPDKKTGKYKNLVSIAEAGEAKEETSPATGEPSTGDDSALISEINGLIEKTPGSKVSRVSKECHWDWEDGQALEGLSHDQLVAIRSMLKA